MSKYKKYYRKAQNLSGNNSKKFRWAGKGLI